MRLGGLHGNQAKCMYTSIQIALLLHVTNQPESMEQVIKTISDGELWTIVDQQCSRHNYSYSAAARGYKLPALCLLENFPSCFRFQS